MVHKIIGYPEESTLHYLVFMPGYLLIDLKENMNELSVTSNCFQTIPLIRIISLRTGSLARAC